MKALLLAPLVTEIITLPMSGLISFKFGPTFATEPASFKEIGKFHNFLYLKKYLSLIQIFHLNKNNLI